MQRLDAAPLAHAIPRGPSAATGIPFACPRCAKVLIQNDGAAGAYSVRDKRVGEGAPWRATILIVAFSLIVIVLTWAAVFDQARFERDEAIAAAIRENTNRVIAFEQYVTRTLDAANAATLHLSDKHASIGGTAANPRWIDDPVVNNAMFGAVTVTNERGDVVATTVSPPPIHMNAAGREAFRVHVPRDTGRLFIGTPREVRTLGRALISLSRRINNPDGSFAGIVAIQMDPGQFTDFYKSAEVRPTDLMSVIGLDGITRARRTGSRSSYGEDLNGMLVMEMQMRDPNVKYVGPGGLDGIVRYFSHRRLAEYPLFVTVGVGRDEVLAPLQARREKYYLGAALLTLGTIAFAGVLIAGLRRRQKNAREIAVANERLHEAQRVGQIGDWEYDIKSGVIKWSSPLYAMYERDPELGPPRYDEVLAYFDAPGRVVVDRAVKLAIETGERQEYEFCMILPDGRVSHRQSVAVPTRDAQGQVIRLHGTDQDITARKLLAALQAEVAHLSRIDAMNTMAATLAHELNQPLTAATNYLAGSKRLANRVEAEESDLIRHGLQGAEQQISLAANIIRRIRDMVANRSSSSEHTPLADVIDDALSLVATANNYSHIALRRDVGPDAGFVAADRVQVQQVLINLVRNACDAMAGIAHPAVTITSERSDPDTVRICVTDNGSGIPDSVGDLFYPFATSKESGLGLGLSICRTIVEAHGGRIWVERSGDCGTTICFTLPMSALELEQAETFELA